MPIVPRKATFMRWLFIFFLGKTTKGRMKCLETFMLATTMIVEPLYADVNVAICLSLSLPPRDL